MPTYTWRCASCGRIEEQLLSIGTYCRTPPAFVCCAQVMPRIIVAPSAPLVMDSDYTGLRAPDGTDISSKAKHRQYMRERGLSTADDWTETWKRAAQERADRLAGDDPSRKGDVAAAIEQLREQGGRRQKSRDF